MEKLSNDIYELRKASKHDIENFTISDNEEVIMYFLEFPSIAGFPYKIALIKENIGDVRIEFRQWDTEYDLKRWSNGIYNLDRLRIITNKKYFSDLELKEFNKLLSNLSNIKLPNSLNDESAIVLDGSDWEFGINTSGIKVDYKWRAATKDIELFVPLIEMIKNGIHNYDK